MLDLLSADPALRACFDTNHLLSEDPADFVRKVGNKIITTHVSDCDFLNERHWYPGEGKIDWPALMRALEEVGYQGPFIYEIGLLASEYHRALTPADLVNTAHEIFAYKTPTRILP
jgi:sugar phosphate isomerase/epimerase